MKLWSPWFHFSDAIGYRSPTLVSESLWLPVSVPPPGPVNVASTPTFARPNSPVMPSDACPPATGVPNT